MTRFLFVISVLFTATPSARAQITYAKDVARIYQSKCQACHRAGDIAPFALDSYEAAKTWGDDIQRVVRDRIMPPWKPVGADGKFQHDFGLSEEQRQTILDWYASGAAEGDAADLPEPLPASGEWQLGEPDAVLRMPELYSVPRRKDVYRCFVVPTGFEEDVWLKSVQVVPGNRQVVHHVILFLDTTTKSEELDAKDEEPGYECFGGPGEGIPLGVGSMAGGWVPGSRASHLPDGVGILIPKGARMIVQMHYFPAGKAHSDQTKVGLYFAKAEETLTKRLVFLPLVNLSFRLPPGDADKEVTVSVPVLPGLTAQAYTIVPHMHLLGKKIEVTRTNPLTRANDSLIRIDDWDFNWQNFYSFRTPVRLNMFDTLKLACRFDNSEGNPRNPSNPLKEVRWGEGTEDEMCLAFLGVAFDNPGILDQLRFSRHNQRP